METEQLPIDGHWMGSPEYIVGIFHQYGALTLHMLTFSEQAL